MNLQIIFEPDTEYLPRPGPLACKLCRGQGVVRLPDGSIRTCPNCCGTGKLSPFMAGEIEKNRAAFEKAVNAGRKYQGAKCGYCGKPAKKKLWRAGFVVCSNRCGEKIAKRQDY